MGKNEKLLAQLLSARSDANIRFDDLCRVLAALGFDERVKGSHHIFTKDGVEEILNLQPKPDARAKPYQVKQVRTLITRHRLGFDEQD